MENTAPTASSRISCKRKAGARDRDTSSKEKHDGSKKTVVRRALNKCTKQSLLAVLRKAVGCGVQSAPGMFWLVNDIYRIWYFVPPLYVILIIDAGRELMNFLSLNEAAICNTWLKRRAFICKHNNTQNLRSSTALTLLFVRTTNLKRCLDSCVKRGVECNTDHNLLCTELRISKLYNVKKGGICGTLVRLKKLRRQNLVERGCGNALGACSVGNEVWYHQSKCQLKMRRKMCVLRLKTSKKDGEDVFLGSWIYKVSFLQIN